MGIIAIGDIHGRASWKIPAFTEKWDKFIFVGDYWDSFNIPYIEQLHNFREICKFKRDNSDKVILLIGNHDFHYMPVAGIYGDQYSGYQHGKAMEIGYEIQQNMDILQMAYKHGEYLFTHAGVTNTWLNWTKNFVDLENMENKPVDEYINKLFKYKPHLFLFNGIDGYGDDVTQSPIWVRPRSLNEDALDYIHVVGHTAQKRIGIEPTKFAYGGSGFFIDTMETAGQYLIIDDNTTHIGRVFGQDDRVKYPSTDFDI